MARSLIDYEFGFYNIDLVKKVIAADADDDVNLNNQSGQCSANKE